MFHCYEHKLTAVP